MAQERTVATPTAGRPWCLACSRNIRSYTLPPHCNRTAYHDDALSICLGSRTSLHTATTRGRGLTSAALLPILTAHWMQGLLKSRNHESSIRAWVTVFM